VKFARQAGAKPRGWIITRDRSYHGATFGAMALSGDSRTQYYIDPQDLQVVHVPPPYAYRCPFGTASDESAASGALATSHASSTTTVPSGGRGADGARRGHQRHRRAGQLLARLRRETRDRGVWLIATR